MIIDNKGITDNSCGRNVGLIRWDDIIDINTYDVASSKLILIGISDVDKYIGMASNAIRKRAMKTSYKMHGTPLTIQSSSLKVKHAKLLELINDAFNQSKKAKTTILH